MKLANVVWQMTEDGYLEVERESIEYSGPVALCDRGTSKQVANQGMQQSAQDQANAQATLAKTNTAVEGQQQQLRSFMNFGRKTYGDNGTFMRDQNTIATTAAAAGARGLGGDLALHAMRTGENTGGYATAAAEDRRQRQRDVTGQMATADASRLANLSNVQQIGLDASKFPAQMYGSLYGPSVSGSTGQLDPAARAAATPSGWDVFGQDLAAAAGAAAGAACPVEGSQILMADGSQKPVEELIVGDAVLGPDGQGDEVLANEPSMQECVELKSGDGKAARCSESHSLIRYFGGYVFAKDALYNVLHGREQTPESTLVSVTPIGQRRVFQLKLKRAHAYCADGFWALE